MTTDCKPYPSSSRPSAARAGIRAPPQAGQGKEWHRWTDPGSKVHGFGIVKATGEKPAYR
ncbi:hypothetical protein LAB1_33270 [Roseibium sp. LAB1]